MKNQPMYIDEVSTDKGRLEGDSLDQGGYPLIHVMPCKVGLVYSCPA